MTVFIPHSTKDDISAARQFGEIAYVNQYYIHGDELERHDDRNFIPRGYRANMQRVLVEFRPEEDYVLMVGDHLQLLALVCAVCSKFGYVTVLRWDRQIQGYIPVTLSSGLAPSSTRVLSSPARDIGEISAQDRSQGEDRRPVENPPEYGPAGWDTDLEGPVVFNPRRFDPS